jgi:5-methylcytosine-specific restriction endonuclease McrA
MGDNATCICGASFRPRIRNGVAVTKYCSPPCSYTGRTKKVSRPCFRCGVQVTRSRSNIMGERIYCSKKCRRNMVERPCTGCGKLVLRKAHVVRVLRRSFCSRPCMWRFKIGAEHACFVHGLSRTKEYGRAREAKRRAWKRGNGGAFTADQILDLFEHQHHQCYWCREILKNDYQIDHRVPLSRGGRSDIQNIVLACRRCNRLKSDKLPEDFAREIGLLVA